MEAHSSTESRTKAFFGGLSERFDPIADRYPLMDRELTRVALDKRMFVLRFMVAGIFGVLILASGLDALTSQTAADMLTGAIIILISIANMLIALAAAPIMTAGLIAEEKQERTLPLLLMADFRGWDIFLAKFLSVFLVCALLMLSTSPLLAIAALLGGVEAGGIVAMLLLSIALLAQSCAVGLWASARARGTREAILITFVLLTCWHAGLVYIEQFVRFGFIAEFVMSPLLGMVELANTGSAPAKWGIGVVEHGAIALIFAFRAVRLLPQLAYEEGRQRARKRRRLAPGATRWLRGHPLVQLIAATTSGFTLSFDSWPLRLVVAVGLAVISGITLGYGIILIALVFCYDIASCMTSIRRSGALDDILATPLDQYRVARAFMRVFAGRALVYLPATLVAAAIILLQVRSEASAWSILASVALLLPSQLFLIISAGSYAGTRTNHAASQAALTILLVGLIVTLAFTISQGVYWYVPSGAWRTAMSEKGTLIITVLLSTLFNLGSGMLCYLAFASQLREDLISNIRPRFQSWLDAFTN